VGADTPGDELIRGGSELGGEPEISIAPPINEVLRVLDPHPDLESLCLELNAPLPEVTPGVACGVACSQDDRVALDLAMVCKHGLNLSLRRVSEREIVHPSAPKEADTSGLHAASKSEEDVVKFVGAHVGTRIKADLFRRPSGDKFIQNGGLQGVVTARVELPVRVGPSASFTEQKIRLGVRHAPSVERHEVLPALFQRAATIDYRYFAAREGERERREGTSRPRPHNDNPARHTSPEMAGGEELRDWSLNDLP
jgi:hypothetical protein